MKISIFAGNGIGGTEKAAFHFAAELSQRGHEVCALTTPDGPRSSTLLSAGVKIDPVPYEKSAIKAHLENFKPHIVHQHVPGYGDHRPLYRAVNEMCGEKPKIIETNVFGRLLDQHDRGHVAFRMFVSRASGCQAFMRPSITQQIPDISKHAVLSNPMPPYKPPSPDRRTEIREDLGISSNDFLVLRIGRPHGKWTTWDCDAFSLARRENPSLRLLLMEPDRELAEMIESGRWGPDILVRKATSDFQYLSDLYGSADAMLHASNFGESYGYTLAEAMQASLPIITFSTPWGDNAQVELVDHGKTGFVCCSTKGMAKALATLAHDPHLSAQMGHAASKRIASISDSVRDTTLLEEIMKSTLGENPGPVMQARFAEWMAYSKTEFALSEFRVFERERAMHTSYARWRCYSGYRTARSTLRHTLNCLRR